MQQADTTLIAHALTFGKDLVPGVEMTNFSPPEEGFIWSNGHWCEIRFDLTEIDGGALHERPQDSVVALTLDLDVFKTAPTLAGQNVLFYVNGLRLASRLITARVTVLLELPVLLARPVGNIITIDLPDATRPADHGGNDVRRLGIQLHALQVTLG